MNKWMLYARLMRIDKPIGSLLLLWPTLWGLWAASGGKPNPDVLLVFIIGTILMRSAGCVMNDYADMEYDPHVERTRERPLASGKVGRKEAMLLALGLSLCAFVLVLFLNRLTIELSFAALFLAASYPFTKRFFAIPQAYLGIAFGFGIPMAFAAETGSVPMLAWVLLLANFFWTIAYDTEYAMVDRDDDIRIGIRTSALTFGRFDVAAVMVCYVIMLMLLTHVGIELGRGIFYYAGLAGAGVLMLYHYALIRNRERDKCFRAFLHNNWVGGVIFIGIFFDYLKFP
ncbi:MAG: 4-hydroxybenzoate octaprenyltransferase [Burkholderiales bacterium]|nr:4-hydroxybenzoate octaprenyltransferase [Burkholderiales bacterium]